MAHPRAVDLARTYLERLQAKNRDGILAILAEDWVLEVPYDPMGANDLRTTWKLDAAAAHYDDAFARIEVLKYVDLDYTAGADDNVAFAEGFGRMRMATGRPYNNWYIFRFDSRDGKLWRIREYLNPVTTALSFGRELPQPQPL